PRRSRSPRRAEKAARAKGMLRRRGFDSWREPRVAHLKAGEITQLLRRAESGDARAQSELMPLVYAELKRVAKSVRGGRDAPLSTTELVHEGYLRLVGGEPLSWPDRN